MIREIESLQRILDRERKARWEAERILEEKSLKLFSANEQLLKMNKSLEAEVSRRMAEIATIARIPMETPEPVLRVSLQGDVLFSNAIASSLEMFTFDQRTFTSASFWHFVATELCHEAAVFQIEATSRELQYCFICRVFTEEGYLNIYGRDVTQLNKTKTDLRRLSLIAEETSNAVIVTDADGITTWVNKGFIEMTGYSLEEAIGKKPGSILQGKDTNPETVAYLSRQIKHKAPFDCEILNYTKSGEPYWVHLQGQPLFDERGEVIQFFAIEDNITEARFAEEALKKREEKYRGIIANMNLGLVEVDNDEIIMYANQSFCNISGYTLDELMGKKAPSVLLRVDQSEFMDAKNQQRKEGISDAYEIAILTKQGQTRWMLISGAPLYSDDGTLIGSIGIHLDITEQKKLEVALRESKQIAEESSKAKELFLANMSHEIRTPMNAIIGMSRLLKKTNLDEQQHIYLDAISTSGQNLLVIINDILDISKIEAGRLTIEQIDFSLADVIEQIRNVVDYKAQEKALNLKFEIDPNLPQWLQGDPYRINQILLNLVGNAIKFTDKGSVTTTCTYLGQHNGLCRIKFAVADTGIGIDQIFLKDIFGNFSQEDSTITRKFGGTGLGLSISKKLVELMGGTIDLESIKGKGTTIFFTLTLPTAHVSHTPKEKTDMSQDMLRLDGRTILLVEDNLLNRLLANMILKNYGATVIEAENGQEACEALKNPHIDLVVMDMQMPIMDGIEATRHIRNQMHLNIPIIALTASALKGDNLHCLEAGMNDYLSKPFEEEALIEKIVYWLGATQNKVETEEAQWKQHPSALYNTSGFEKTTRGNQTLVRVLLKAFVDQSSQTLSEMQEAAFGEPDFPRLRKLAHSLKPTLANIELNLIHNDILRLEKWNLDTNAPDSDLHSTLHRIGEVIQTVNADIATRYLATDV
jgi:PAS domain S-box-containing protein